MLRPCGHVRTPLVLIFPFVRSSIPCLCEKENSRLIFPLPFPECGSQYFKAQVSKPPLSPPEAFPGRVLVGGLCQQRSEIRIDHAVVVQLSLSFVARAAQVTFSSLIHLRYLKNEYGPLWSGNKFAFPRNASFHLSTKNFCLNTRGVKIIEGIWIQTSVLIRHQESTEDRPDRGCSVIRESLHNAHETCHFPGALWPPVKATLAPLSLCEGEGKHFDIVLSSEADLNDAHLKTLNEKCSVGWRVADNP